MEIDTKYVRRSYQSEYQTLDDLLAMIAREPALALRLDENEIREICNKAAVSEASRPGYEIITVGDYDELPVRRVVVGPDGEAKVSTIGYNVRPGLNPAQHLWNSHELLIVNPKKKPSIWLINSEDRSSRQIL